MSVHTTIACDVCLRAIQTSNVDRQPYLSVSMNSEAPSDAGGAVWDEFWSWEVCAECAPRVLDAVVALAGSGKERS